jgi:hypothetical protein
MEGYMIGSLLKATAYSKAPRTTFSVLHPKEAARLKKLDWDMKHAYAPRVAALGVALLALPIGVLLGRLTARRHEPARGPRVNPNVRRTGWPDEVGARGPAGEVDDHAPLGYEAAPPRPAARGRPRSAGTTARTTATGTAPTTASLTTDVNGGTHQDG